MLTHNDYALDPEIQFSKVFCPFCNEPTGPKSRCHESEAAQRTPPHGKRGINAATNQLLPILSLHCHFRKINAWEATTNVPVSNELLEELKRLPGINRIAPQAAYTFQFEIGLLFDERIVKNSIAATYRNFVKIRQARYGSIFEALPIHTLVPVSASGNH